MQHSDCTPRIPTVTAEEAVKMSWLWSSSQTLKEVSQLFNAITEVPNEFAYIASWGLSPPFGTLAGCRASGKNAPGGSAGHRPSNSDRNTL